MTTRPARLLIALAVTVWLVAATWAGYQWDPLGMTGPPDSEYAIPLVAVMTLMYAVMPLLFVPLAVFVVVTIGRWIWYGPVEGAQ